MRAVERPSSPPRIADANIDPEWAVKGVTVGDSAPDRSDSCSRGGEIELATSMTAVRDRTETPTRAGRRAGWGME
jgi:hypothetical protein